eukprot:EG_transcript_10083
MFLPRRCHWVSGPLLRRLFASGPDLSDTEVLQQLVAKKLRVHQLEDILAPDYERAVRLRREYVKTTITAGSGNGDALEQLPYQGYNWGRVHGANCENVIGYLPIPVGIAGPLLVDGAEFAIPMATTEGALLASTHRGARALNEAGGVKTVVLDDGMTRGPYVVLPSLQRANEMRQFVEADDFAEVRKAFQSTTRFGKLKHVKMMIVGRRLYMRFKCTTGDAMGMNMVTKGVNKVLDVLQERFPDMQIGTLSGNYCVDKKPSAMNWLEGRGKSIVAEAVLSNRIVQEVLKSDVRSMVQLNIDKNLIGSALSGSIGGNNAHAANVVAAIFIATGQDPAQVVASSNCLTNMEEVDGNLYMSVTMPTIEVGTVGGGTALPAQHSMLRLIGVAGAHPSQPGQNSTALARLIASAVMAGEISLIAAQAAGHLTSAHMKLNRK